MDYEANFFRLKFNDEKAHLSSSIFSPEKEERQLNVYLPFAKGVEWLQISPIRLNKGLKLANRIGTWHRATTWQQMALICANFGWLNVSM